MAVVELCSFFAQFTKQKKRIHIEESTLEIVLSCLANNYPLLKPYLFNEQGNICSSINVYINGEDIRFLKKPIIINKTDILNILPAIAGG